MKKCRIIGLTFLIIIWASKITTAQRPHLTNRNKLSILSYFKAIIKDSLVIVGQHCGDGNQGVEGYKSYVEDLHVNTNKYPALIGVDYGFTPNNNIALINQPVIKHWKSGGLVTVCWHANNPFADGGYNPRINSVVFKSNIIFKNLFKNAPESKAKNIYRSELKRVGQGLLELKKAGVTVIWRPFHEMNGTWFWWGTNDRENPTNQNDFGLLWQDMYHYFTDELGLDNLIWVYSPNYSNGGTSSIFSQYPGYKYVDVVGVDIYNNTPEFKNYNELKKFNKPIVVGEVGPTKEVFGNFNENDLIKTFRGKAAYFLQWSSYKDARVAIIDNFKVNEMMNNPYAITLDKLK